MECMEPNSETTRLEEDAFSIFSIRLGLIIRPPYDFPFGLELTKVGDSDLELNCLGDASDAMGVGKVDISSNAGDRGDICVLISTLNGTR
jgi:hypothetical protein